MVKINDKKQKKTRKKSKGDKTKKNVPKDEFLNMKKC